MALLQGQLAAASNSAIKATQHAQHARHKEHMMCRKQALPLLCRFPALGSTMQLFQILLHAYSMAHTEEAQLAMQVWVDDEKYLQRTHAVCAHQLVTWKRSLPNTPFRSARCHLLDTMRNNRSRCWVHDGASHNSLREMAGRLSVVYPAPNPKFQRSSN